MHICIRLSSAKPLWGSAHEVLSSRQHVLRFLHVTGIVATTWCSWWFICAEHWKWCRTMWRHPKLVERMWQCVLFAWWCIFIDYVRKSDVVGKIHLPWTFSGLQMNLEKFLVWRVCAEVEGGFSNTFACVFQQQLWLGMFSTELHKFSGSCMFFWMMFWTILQFATTMRMRRRCFWCVWKWIQTSWIHLTWWQFGENVLEKKQNVFFACHCCRFTQRRHQLEQERFNVCMVHVQDN